MVVREPFIPFQSHDPAYHDPAYATSAGGAFQDYNAKLHGGA